MKRKRKAGSNWTSPTKCKKSRRGKAEIAVLRESLVDLVSRNEPCTCRQVFYLAVSAKLIPKLESEYKGTICRLLGDLREEGEIPYWHIVDFTRSMRKPDSFGSVEEALNDTARFYRKDIWRQLSERVEVWCEKDAVGGVLLGETWDFDVPLMSTRGYPSKSFVYSAAKEIRAAGVPAYIYYFGDHDPSGCDIPRVVEQGLRKHAPDSEIHFERVAVNPHQITGFDLTTRPTKKTDSRSKNFKGESVDVEAIPPRILRDLCRGCIEDHIPDGALDVLKIAEESEREQIKMFALDASG